MDTPLSTLPSREFDYWKAQHLLNRAGFGGTPAQVRAVANMGLDDAVDYLIDYEKVTTETLDTDAFDSAIMRPATEPERQERNRARQSQDEATLEKYRRLRQERQRTDRRQMSDIQRWWLQKMIESPRPLEEKMTLFWHGHFATGYRAIEDSYHMYLQNLMLRKHATGNFRNDLVRGIIRDPAMIKYLNNDQNNRQSPNENLARELMELFTLGEGQGYTEDDIKEGARSLTGFTRVDDAFYFNQRNHDSDSKNLLGRRGDFNGDDFVDLIFRRPSAATFITEKLYRFFVNDAPGELDKTQQRFVRSLAALLKDRQWELKPILRRLFKTKHFYDESNTGSLIKSPIQLIVQTIRSLRTPPDRSVSLLVDAAGVMGQRIFFPPNVKGWDGGRAWINTSTLFTRQNIVLYLLTGRQPGEAAWDSSLDLYDATHLLDHLADDRGEIKIDDGVTWLMRFALGGEPRQHDARSQIEMFVQGHGRRFTNEVLIGSLALISGMPEYQLC